MSLLAVARRLPVRGRRQFAVLLLIALCLVSVSTYSTFLSDAPVHSLFSRRRANPQAKVAQAAFSSPHRTDRTAEDRLEDADKVRELMHLFEAHPLDGPHEDMPWLSSSLSRLEGCLRSNTCGPGEETVVVLASFHFGMAKIGAVSGEDIWAGSTMSALSALNVTSLYVPHARNVHVVHAHLGDLIRFILWEGEELRYCLNEGPGILALPNCIKRDGYEAGIPAWKGMTFHWWGDSQSPLGSGWTVSPENYGDVDDGKNRYLGYSIEQSCTLLPAYPAEERYHRAMLLGKNREYFLPPRMAFPGMLTDAAHAVDPARNMTTGEDEPFRFSTTTPVPQPEEGVSDETRTGEDAFVFPEAEVVEFLRIQGKDAWFEELGRSKALLGVGWPEWSPSPYDAMCMGVPFINVIKLYDEQDPEDRDKWFTQHNGLNHLNPPYVYHVREGNATELATAVNAAVEHPIERYIPERMTFKAVVDRHRALLETDWEAEARMGPMSGSLVMENGVMLLL